MYGWEYGLLLGHGINDVQIKLRVPLIARVKRDHVIPPRIRTLDFSRTLHNNGMV
jgi:hypothetical protein